MEQSRRMPQPTQVMSQQTLILSEGNQTMHLDESGLTAERVQQYIHLGSVLNGRYTLTRVLSENTGEAALFICTDGEREFVAKIYHVNKRPKSEISELIRSLNSPHVIQIIDTGEIEQRFFEILPYYREGDLAQAAPLEASFMIETVVPSVAAALHELHENGIVHRDIKPNNLFFTDDRHQVVVGDFGISSLIDTKQSVRYTSGSRTIGYSAPETAQGFISKESDYYSLGITLLHLVTGLDPFAGMNEQQILKVTLTDKLQIPATIDPRLSHLIRGLTIKERVDRWGYSEIRKWSIGEAVPVNDSKMDLKHIRPYSFQGRKFNDLNELTLAFAERWSEATKHLYRGLISDYAKQLGQDIASQVMDCEEERDQDIGIFKMLYVLNPLAPLAWKGQIYFDLQSLGEAMHNSIPAVRSDYLELLQKGALSHFLRIQDFNDELVQEVEALQERSDTEPEVAYFKLYYLIRNTEEFIFEKRSFRTVDALVEFLHAERMRVEELSKRLIKYPFFFAWLEHLGYSEQLQYWRNISY